MSDMTDAEVTLSDWLATAEAERDALRAECERLRAIVTAVRHEHATRAAWLATLPACATAPADVVAAEAATAQALAPVTP